MTWISTFRKVFLALALLAGLNTRGRCAEINDDFNNKSSYHNSWIRHNDAVWSLKSESGNAYCAADVMEKSAVMVHRRAAPAGPYDLSARIRIDSFGAQPSAGGGMLLCTAASLNDGLSVTLRRDNQIVIKNLKENKVLAGVRLPEGFVEEGRWYHFTLKVRENAVEAWVDNQMRVSASIPQAPDLRAGLVVANARVSFDDFQLQTLPAQSQPVTQPAVADGTIHNIAAGFRVISNDEAIPNFPPALAADGNPLTCWRTGSNKSYLQLMADKPVPICGVRLTYPDTPAQIADSALVELRIKGEWVSVMSFKGNKDRSVARNFEQPLLADAVRYHCLKTPGFERALAEMEILSAAPTPIRPESHNLTADAAVETSHKRRGGGQVALAVDGRRATTWIAGPYAHLLLRYDRDVEIEKICLDFGSREARSIAYLIQLRQGDTWVNAVEINHNEEVTRTHTLSPGTMASGVRWIPLTTAQVSDTRLAEIQIWGYGSAGPWRANPSRWEKIIADKNARREPAIGIFALDHWRDIFPVPDGRYVDGVEYNINWADLEPREGQFDWSALDQVLFECANHHQKVVLKVMASDHCPPWIFDKGVPKVLPADAPQKLKTAYDPPKYWDARYLALLKNMVNAVARRYDGNRYIDSVIMTFAGNGEMGRFAEFPHTIWQQAGYTDDIFADAMNRIVDMYTDSFTLTPLMCQVSYIGSSGSATPALLVSEHAARRGVMVEQAALDDLLSYAGDKRASIEGRVNFIDIYQRIRGQTPLAGEANQGYSYNQTTDYPSRFPEVLWQSYLNGLALGFTHFTIYQADLLQPSAREINAFARRRLGKDAANTPSVWINLRGAPLENPSVGMTLVDADDGHTLVPAGLIAKRLCRQTDLAHGQDRMYFKISPKFLQNEKRGMICRVIYLDQGNDAWSLVYRDSEGREQTAKRLESSSPDFPLSMAVNKQDTRRWKEAVFAIPTLRTNDAWHIAINANRDGNEYIHFVEVAGAATHLDNILNSDAMLP